MVALLMRSELEANDIIWCEDRDMVCVRVDRYLQECRLIAEGTPTPLHSSSRLNLPITCNAYRRKGETKKHHERQSAEVALLVLRVLQENSLRASWDGDIYSPIFVKLEPLPAQ